PRRLQRQGQPALSLRLRRRAGNDLRRGGQRQRGPLQPLPAQPRLQNQGRRSQGGRRAARQLRAHRHPEPVPAGLDAWARRCAQGGTAAAEPAQRALCRGDRVMPDATVAVPFWLLLAAGGLWLLTVASLAVRLRCAPRRAGTTAADDAGARLEALETQLQEALTRLKVAARTAEEAEQASKAK